MSTVAEIAAAFRKLPADEAWQLADHLPDHLDHLWDAELKRDVAAGRLDGRVAKARADYEAGRTKPLDNILNER